MQVSLASLAAQTAYDACVATFPTSPAMCGNQQGAPGGGAPIAAPVAQSPSIVGAATQQVDSQVITSYLSAHNITSITAQSVQYGMYQAGFVPGSITGANVASYLAGLTANAAVTSSTSTVSTPLMLAALAVGAFLLFRSK